MLSRLGTSTKAYLAVNTKNAPKMQVDRHGSSVKNTKTNTLWASIPSEAIQIED